MSTTTTQRLSVEDAIYAVERLLSWADNEDQVTTFDKFLCLTGIWEVGGEVWVTEGGHWECGYLECSLLAAALEAWATHPNDVRQWLVDQGN